MTSCKKPKYPFSFSNPFFLLGFKTFVGQWQRRERIGERYGGREMGNGVSISLRATHRTKPPFFFFDKVHYKKTNRILPVWQAIDEHYSNGVCGGCALHRRGHFERVAVMNGARPFALLALAATGFVVGTEACLSLPGSRSACLRGVKMLATSFTPHHAIDAYLKY